MYRTRLAAVGLFALTIFSSSCAVTGGEEQATSRATSQPAARLGLPAAYRVFYDELADYGDWALVEPFGWVFRPAVNFVAWRPYQEGYWTPSDYYGWVWNSTESFGWITDHYGDWFYDSFQGWVWAPGPVWAPSWVAWAQADDYIGWAPLPPRGYNSFSSVPGGAFTFVGARDFVSQAPGTQALFVTALPAAKTELTPIFNVGRAGGVAFNKGPDPLLLQRLVHAPVPHGDDPQVRRVKLSGVSPDSHSEADLEARTRIVFSEARRELSQLRESGIAPPPAPGGDRPLLWRKGEPVVKPPATPVVRDSSRFKRSPPRDTTATRSPAKPPRSQRPLDKPGAAPDTTHG